MATGYGIIHTECTATTLNMHMQAATRVFMYVAGQLGIMPWKILQSKLTPLTPRCYQAASNPLKIGHCQKSPDKKCFPKSQGLHQ